MRIHALSRKAIALRQAADKHPGLFPDADRLSRRTVTRLIQALEYQESNFPAEVVKRGPVPE
jgi:hypothetical protein